MLPTDKGLLSKPKATTIVGVNSVDLDGESERSTSMDSDKCLCCILQNSTLKLVAIFFSSSQIIGGTSQLYHTFVSSLEENKDEEEKRDREGNEDGETRGGVLTF
ncbi:hypothetical protein PVL29_023246 [Vitis rotundifolia]|uniref:Uncharacterized protein n=1 Tax=Vitis rotundifolia TaxID=103349 RepID=A0AA38YN65_VITRO|nr:hypothetical protein PVL29_023246 [Vitis rotundifolia]